MLGFLVLAAGHCPVGGELLHEDGGVLGAISGDSMTNKFAMETAEEADEEEEEEDEQLSYGRREVRGEQRDGNIGIGVRAHSQGRWQWLYCVSWRADFIIRWENERVTWGIPWMARYPNPKPLQSYHFYLVSDQKGSSRVRVAVIPPRRRLH